MKYEFFNGWYFLIIISDILTIAGSINKLIITIEVSKNDVVARC